MSEELEVIANGSIESVELSVVALDQSSQLAFNAFGVIAWESLILLLVAFGVFVNLFTWHAIVNDAEHYASQYGFLVRLTAACDAATSLGAIGNMVVPQLLAVLGGVWLTSTPCALLGTLGSYTAGLSINAQMLLAVNRLLAVVAPECYKKLGNRFWLIALCVLSIPGLLMFGMAIFNTHFGFVHARVFADCHILPHSSSPAADVFEALLPLLIVMPLVVGLIAYAVMFARVQLARADVRIELERRAQGSLAPFIAFGLYTLALVFIATMMSMPDVWRSQPLLFFPGVFWYRLNFAINPICYYIANRKLRNAYNKLASYYVGSDTDAVIDDDGKSDVPHRTIQLGTISQ